ncbi:CoF synthetase [Cronobacter malonaticus]|uniref:F390 synthetase-related protein n=1 Tax=Cronobacter malonaticus TaxID=413503 RepID=UPI00051929DA|nr:F390 synthetase-related protein [Cronobacter malonaticus]EGT4382551.1 CoF synthetase [Cronobacter malonaticus]EGT4419662.1 CoF synthetase [Cronobacter malonaticus]EGT4444714.1 CoF synthetase [Cronobacter malonaticus]EGT4453745.1 CoF synthetase [Cronobacter malonaticus]EKP4388329.1 CoF synthetase [Cronobacter malonaticus]
MNKLAMLWHYFRVKRLRFHSRAALERYQQKQLGRFAARVLAKSPWFRRYRTLPFGEWQIMDKALMMAHFDEMNTGGLKAADVMACALKSENDRNFTPTVGRYSVGLSSGTSGQRGIFAVSPQEQALWAGAMLAKMLPDGLFAGERVALFLRADNNLYQSVNHRWLSLGFYDLFAPFEALLTRLEAESPSIIVAPAQVLRALALAAQAGELKIAPKKVISVAEVLDAQDRALLENVFPDVGEVYQATEGFLAATCAHGVLHLNEAFIFVEKEWLDARRFVPIITDFTRTTQPIVRYRLDDVLTVRETPCACGDPSLALAHIEGRQDDQLLLPDGQGGERAIFGDLCNRALARVLPFTADYRLIQHGAKRLTLIVEADDAQRAQAQAALIALFEQQGVACSVLRWTLLSQIPQAPAGAKRRRIVRVRDCA